MVQIDIEYEGQLRCSAVHQPSGNRILTDAPVDNNGKGEAFSPTDLVATALGGCMVTIMGMVAERRDLDLTGTKVRVVKHMVADPERRIGKIELIIRVPRDLSEKERTLVERAAYTCPVHKSIHPDIEVPVTFEYGAA